MKTIAYWLLSALLLTAVARADSEPPVAVAIFAGGCFWCMEKPFDSLDGVLSTTSGYTGGPAEKAHYKIVSAGGSGHYEAVKVEYDPSKVSYQSLLETFWLNVDPFDGSGQFCDKGSQYRSAIFYRDAEQQQAAAASRERVAAQFKKKIATEVLAATAFYPAEDYHQDYYLKNPARYNYYRWGCGRDKRLEAVWGKSDH